VRRTVIVLLLCSIPADAAPRVQLDIDVCVGDARAELERVITIEAGDTLAASAAAGDALHATVRCDPQGLVLHVDDPLTHRSVWRRVGAAAEPRLIALALVELIAASSSELAPPAMPEPLLRETLPPNATLAPIVLPLDSPRLQLTAGALHFSAANQTLAGAGLRFTAPLRGSLRWLIDAQAHHAAEATMLGVLSTQLFALGAGAQLQLGEGRTRVNVGGGLRGGAVHVSGVPGGPMVQGGSFWSRWLGPMALASVAYAVTHRLAIEAATEAGYVIAPVHGLAGTETAVAIDGIWMQFHVGLALQLWLP
jgi:hypothetical protein